MKNEPVYVNDLNKWHYLTLPAQQAYISRGHESLKLSLSSFLYPFPSLTNVCFQRGKKRFISLKFPFIGSEAAKENNLSLGSNVSSKERCGRESNLETFFGPEQLPP